nr:EOG090X0BB3 [Ilyocryptus agilis]
MWLEFEKHPLKWHYPVGLLYDLFVSDMTLPWQVTVHFDKYPENKIMKCPTKDVVESHLMSSLKEADAMKHKSHIMPLMQERDHNQLWLGLLHDKFDQFWSVNRKLMEHAAEEGFRHIPFRLYVPELSTRPFIQFLIKPVENERKTTVEDLLQKANLKLESKGAFDVITHGIDIPRETPLQWMSEHLSYPDNFLHLCIRYSLTHIACAVVGLPVNALVVYFIIRRRRLHNIRNATWLGIIFSNSFILLNHLLEVYAVEQQSETACRIYVFLVGLPYSTLILSLILALADRYVSISYPTFYKRHARRMCLAIIGEFVSFGLLCIIAKSSYVFGGMTTVLVAAQLTGQIVVYCKVRDCLAVDGVVTARNIGETELSTIQINCSVNGNRCSSFFVRIGSNSVSRLEVEATRNVTVGVLAFSLFSFPILVTSAMYFGCVQITGDNAECGTYIWALSYARELVQLHSIYNPVSFSIRSPDFYAAVSRR